MNYILDDWAEYSAIARMEADKLKMADEVAQLNYVSAWLEVVNYFILLRSKYEIPEDDNGMLVYVHQEGGVDDDGHSYGIAIDIENDKKHLQYLSFNVDVSYYHDSRYLEDGTAFTVNFHIDGKKTVTVTNNAGFQREFRKFKQLVEAFLLEYST